MSFSNILRSTGGEWEIGRVSLAIGGFASVITPILFEIYEIGWNGGHFDVTAWCVAYPGGLAALTASGIFVIGNKEKQVALARLTVAQPPLDDTTTPPGKKVDQ